jgi:hypothetical protein
MSEVVKHLNDLGKWFLSKKNLSNLIEKYNSLSTEKKEYIDSNYINLSNEDLVKWLNEDSEVFNPTSNSKSNDVDISNDLVTKKLNEIQKTVNSNNMILNIFLIFSVISLLITTYTYFKYL